MNRNTTGARFYRVPEALYVLVGPPGSGKSTLRQKLLDHGLSPDAVVCPDDVRARPEFGGDASNQNHNAAVFAYANRLVDIRLRAGVPVLFDATNLDGPSRRRQVAAAKRAHLPAIAFLSAPRSLDELDARANGPRNRPVPRDVLERMYARFVSLSAEKLYADGFDRVIVFDDDTEVDVLRSDGDWRHVRGPFAVISDVHNCRDTLENLLATLGFDENLQHPEGLFPIVNGDVLTKGGRLADNTLDPANFDAARCLRWVLEHFRMGHLGWVLGNNEIAVVQGLYPHNGTIPVNAADTLDALRAQPDADELTKGFAATVSRLPHRLHLRDAGRDIYVAHAGCTTASESPSDDYHFAISASEKWTDYWDTNAVAVYGHTRQTNGPRVRENAHGGATIGIETSAYLGAGLTAYRTDTQELVTEPSLSHDVAPAHRIARYDEEKRQRRAEKARRLALA